MDGYLGVFLGINSKQRKDVFTKENKGKQRF